MSVAANTDAPQAVQLRRVVYITDGLVDPTTAPYHQMPLIAPNHIESGTGRLHNEAESAADQAAISGKGLVRAGQVVYSKIRPGLNKVTIAPYDCLCSADMYALETRSHLLAERYLLYALLDQRFLDQAVVVSDRVAMPKVNRETLLSLTIPLPDVGTQQLVAHFLDRETAQIDALIEAQRTLIDRAVERRTVIIDQAIRQGVRSGVPTRESGIPWIGPVPSHWEVRPLGTIGRARIGLTYEPNEIVEADGGTLVLRAGNVQKGLLSLEDCVYVSTPVPQELRLASGDLLICARNGSARLIGKNLLIGPEVEGQTWGAFMSVFRSPMNPHVRWVLNSSILAQQIGLFSTSTINQLTTGMLHSMRVPVPPECERAEIDAYLTEATARTDRLIRAAENAIELMRERRSALISAALTGRIDPRTGEEAPEKVLEFA